MSDAKRDWDGLSDGDLKGRHGQRLDRPSEWPEPHRKEWCTFETETYDLPCADGRRKVVLCLRPIAKLIVFGHMNYLFHQTYAPGDDDTERCETEGSVWDAFRNHYGPKIERRPG